MNYKALQEVVKADEDQRMKMLRKLPEFYCPFRISTSSDAVIYILFYCHYSSLWLTN